MSELQLLRESGIAIDFSKVQLSEAILESTNDKGMYLTLPVCILDKPTANKRTYTSEMMSKSIQEAATAIAGRRLLCSADDHPQGTHVAPIHASHIVIEAWVDNGVLWNKWFILDTDNGRNLQALIRGRASVGTSIRGLGSMSRLNHVENYQYLGTDAVGNPAAGTYALPGVEGVKVEVCESFTEDFEESPKPSLKQIAKKFGYDNNPSDNSPHEYNHSLGHSLILSGDNFTHIHKNGNRLKGQGYSNLFKHLRGLHDQKEGIGESFTEDFEESPKPSLKQIAKKFGYDNNPSDNSPHEYNHSLGHSLILSGDNFTHIHKNGNRLKGQGYSNLFKHLRGLHDQKEGIGVNIPGIGESVMNKSHDELVSIAQKYNYKKVNRFGVHDVSTEMRHPNGHTLSISRDGEYDHHNAETNEPNSSNDPSRLKSLLAKVHSRKESIFSEESDPNKILNKYGYKRVGSDNSGVYHEHPSGAVDIDGVGSVRFNSKIQYKGLEWRVENISGNSDQWQMTLSNPGNAQVNTWLRSEDIPNPASQIVIIAESKGNVMSKVQNYLVKINEAASKLSDITQKSNSKHDQLKFISMFESDLSNAKDLSGEELKDVLEQWESLKVEACKPKSRSSIDDQMNQLQGTVSELTSLVNKVLNNKLIKVNEEEQKQIAVMRQFYNFDDRKIREALSAYTAHKDDPRSFAEELISRLGVQVGGVNLGQLFDDLTDAAGDYQHTGLPAVAQNLVTSEELQSENAEYEALLGEFVTKIDSGELLSKEFVIEQMVKVITESRNTIRRHQVREALAVEVAVETIIKSTLNSKKLSESNKQNAQLVEALTVIINNLRESLLKKEGKIIATDYTKDKKTFIPGRITR